MSLPLQMHRSWAAVPHRRPERPRAAARPARKVRAVGYVLVPVLLLTVSATSSVAIDPTAICFGGSGKAKIDIVNCTRALMPSKSLTRATLLTRRARAYIQLRDDARALQDLERALKINPLSSEAFTEKGRALRFLGRPKEAREALDKALEVSPNDFRALTSRGVLALTLGDHDAAIKDLSKLMAINLPGGESFVLRAIAHYFTDNPTAALRDFREAAALGFAYEYLPLWIALAQQRIGEPADRGLEQARADLLDDQDWPAPVIAMYQVAGTCCACSRPGSGQSGCAAVATRASRAGSLSAR